MTSQSPDPDPAKIPGLEPGGGVAPGTTPPDAAQTSAGAEPQPSTKRRLSPAAVITIVVTVIFVLAFVATAVLLILKMAGALG